MSHLPAIQEEPIFFDAIKNGHVGRLIEFFKTHPDADINARGLQGETGLFWAAQSGDVRMIEECLKRGADVDAVDAKGQSALFWAVKKAKHESINALIHNGASINKQDNNGLTILMFSTISETSELMHQLLTFHPQLDLATYKSQRIALFHTAKKGWDDAVRAMVARQPELLQKTDPNGGSVLFYAVQSGQCRMVETLLELGCTIDHLSTSGVIQRNDGFMPQYDGLTPLLFAAQQGFTEIVELLVKRGADIRKTNPVGFNALSLAILNGHPVLAKRLIEMGCPIQSDSTPEDRRPLLAAAAKGYTEVVELLLRNGANPQERDPQKDWNVLFYAVYYQHLPVVQMLIRMGYPLNYVNKNGTIAFITAAKKGNIPIIEALAPHVDITHADLEGRNALYWAIFYGHSPEVIQKLIDLGCPINHKILCEAALKGNLEAIELLVRHGGNLNPPPPTVSILAYAVYNGNPVLVQRVIDLGAPANHIFGPEHTTALLLAAREGRADIIPILVNAGAQLNYRDHNGSNALENAIENGHTRDVQKLIELGIPLEEVNEQTGLTPLLFAAGKGHTEIVQALIEAGANIRLTEENGQNALYLAADNGHLSTVEYLLRL